MFWKLHLDYALRGWLDLPYTLFRTSDGQTFPVSESAFHTLALCDGQTPIPSGDGLMAFRERGWIEPCEASEPIANEQRPAQYDVAHFRSVNIAVTGRCNYNCRHCFMAKDNGAHRGEFSFAQLTKLLDSFVRCGITRISLTGGEPFIRKDFDALLKAIAQRGLALENITTNGSLIADETLSLMRSLGQKPLMRVSYDGMGWHDWMRGVTGAESTALDAIRRLKAAGFPIMVQMCVHTGNIGTMRETAELMAGLGVDKLRIIRTGESPRWVERMDHSALSFEAYYDAALELLAWYVRTGYQMELIVWSFVHYFAKIGRFHCLPVRCPTGACDAGAPVCCDICDELFIGYDGELTPCSQISALLGVAGISLGNVLAESGLAPLLRESPFLDTIRLSKQALTDANGECRDCEHMRYCLGGCRAMGYAMSGDYTGADRMSCVFFKKGYWRRLYDTIKTNQKLAQ